MRRKRILMLIGSVCLALMLAVPLAVSCGPATPEEAAEEVAALESEIDELEGDVAAKDAEISDLEAEIAGLRAPAEVFSFKYATYAYPGDIMELNCQQFCDEVEKASAGQITLDYSCGGEVVTEPEHLEAIRSGLIDVGMPWAAIHKGALPECEVEGGLPGVMLLPHEWAILFWDRGWNEIFRENYATYNCYYLAPALSIGTYLYLTEPISSLDDLPGRRVRSIGAHASLFDKLGAKVTMVPYGEIYTALATGTIDGYCGPCLSESVVIKLYEFAKYVVYPPALSNQPTPQLVNMDTWNSLPEELQNVLLVAAQACDYRSTIGYWGAEGEAWGEMKGYGCEKIHLSEADVAKWVSAGVEVWDDVATKSPRCAELIQILTDYSMELGYIE